MPRLLDYLKQCSELEKMARLTPSIREEPPPAARPGLASPSPDATCLVCSARPARPCTACGAVAYCDEEHQNTDARWHAAICPQLKKIAEDAENAAQASPQSVTTQFLFNANSKLKQPPTSWDPLLDPGLSAARRRRMTDLATRPLTLALIFNIINNNNKISPFLITPPAPEPIRVHIMAAAQPELDVSPALWAALGRPLELTLIGPELPAAPPTLSPGAPNLYKGLYRRELWRQLGRPHLIIGYNCGLLLYPGWKQTILDLRGAGVPFAITSYRAWEAAGEARVLAAVGAVRLFGPEPNPFASLAGRRSTTIANDVSYDNAVVSAWR